MWKKPNPTRDKIFALADLMRKQGVVPTTINIRAKLGGSQTTASKYLREWRELYDVEADFSPKQMRQKLKEQSKVNEELTTQVITLNQEILERNSKIAELESRIVEAEAKLSESRLQMQSIATMFNSAKEDMKASFDSAVSILSEQISVINEQAICKIQEVGNHFDEAVIATRLELRELQKKQSTVK